jgi:hypothetical protein
MAIQKHLDGVNVWTEGDVNVRMEVHSHREDTTQQMTERVRQAELWEVNPNGSDGTLKALSGLYDANMVQLTLAQVIRHLRDGYILPAV